jgi:predicted XRE-type DNA-binding protein
MTVFRLFPQSFTAQLTLQIHAILKDRGMTQVEIAKILGVQQPQVSFADTESRG